MHDVSYSDKDKVKKIRRKLQSFMKHLERSKDGNDTIRLNGTISAGNLASPANASKLVILGPRGGDNVLYTDQQQSLARVVDVERGRNTRLIVSENIWVQNNAVMITTCADTVMVIVQDPIFKDCQNEVVGSEVVEGERAVRVPKFEAQVGESVRFTVFMQSMIFVALWQRDVMSMTGNLSDVSKDMFKDKLSGAISNEWKVDLSSRLSMSGKESLSAAFSDKLTELLSATH
ncbi:hypothetical protein B0H13DRAFT_1905768 [Mycena leptocephala]|nr:hypothetical protein B0H13DRAFT_1905768 [Mycena leptocephala]